MAHPISLKRIYDPVEDGDGARILVDLVWPRGVSKVDARLDWWAKELAPSSKLRKWFGDDPARWVEFRRNYRDELAQVPESLSKLLDYCRQGPLTLLFGTRDRKHNQGEVLKEVLLEEIAEDERANESASPVCYGNDFPNENGQS